MRSRPAAVGPSEGTEARRTLARIFADPRNRHRGRTKGRTMDAMWSLVVRGSTLVMVLGAEAHADTDHTQDRARINLQLAIRPHVDPGGASFRGFVGGGYLLTATGPIFVGAGFHLGSNYTSVARHPDGRRGREAGRDYVTLGPELRVGLTGAGSAIGPAHAYVAGALALVVDKGIADAAGRTVRSTPAGPSVGGVGMRAALGASFGASYYGRVAGALDRPMDSGRSQDPPLEGFAVLAFVLPTVYELEWEHVPGHHRLGVSFGWGF
ncbi:MAG: hypothetical protein HS111_17820 [Kofleriaceae bacterium]|nr:hypothetical protein [Kofleriaceae bacterium]